MMCGRAARISPMSKYTSYDDANAKCPYYTGSTETEIRCEGFVQDTFIVQRFLSRDARNAYRAEYCDNIRWYGCCLIARLHYEKDSEE